MSKISNVTSHPGRNDANNGMRYGFVPEPRGRGTCGILWTCLTTLFLCTWTVQHLNVGSLNESRWRKSLRKTKWMTITLIAPEYTTVLALHQYLQARRTVATMQSLPDYGWWTMKHSYYALMGGLIVQTPEDTCYRFNCNDLCWLQQKTVIALPHVTIEDIRDRSKADGLTKGLTCAQAAWFLVQSIGRWSQGLPFTTLEVCAISLVLCTFLTYFFWWQKPLDLDTATTLTASAITDDHLAHLRAQDSKWYQRPMLEDFTIPRIPNGLRLDWFGNGMEQQDQRNPNTYWLIVVGISFCAFHIATWNFDFPTQVEQVMWNVCTLSAGGCLFLWLLIPKAEELGSILDWVILSVHVACRIFIAVEVFLGLRALPPGCFDTVNWSLYIPHIS